MCSVLLQWYNIALLLCVSVCILPSQSLCCQKASSALIEERRKREGQIMEQEMTKEGWIERMVKIVKGTDGKGKDSGLND